MKCNDMQRGGVSTLPTLHVTHEECQESAKAMSCLHHAPPCWLLQAQEWVRVRCDEGSTRRRAISTLRRPLKRIACVRPFCVKHHTFCVMCHTARVMCHTARVRPFRVMPHHLQSGHHDHGSRASRYTISILSWV